MRRLVHINDKYEIDEAAAVYKIDTGRRLTVNSKGFVRLATTARLSEDRKPEQLLYYAFPELRKGKTAQGLSRYEVYEDGTVRSLITMDILKAAKSKTGYYNVCLTADDSTKRTVQVHRLVAMAYLPAVEGKDQVNHKNGDKLDNRAENLEWCTPRENLVHAYTTGLNDTKLRRCKVSADNGETWTEYNSLKEAADMLGVLQGEVTTTVRLNNNVTATNSGVPIRYNPYTCHGNIIMYTDSAVQLCENSAERRTALQQVTGAGSKAIEISVDGICWKQFPNTVQAAIYASGGTTKYGKYIAERADYNQVLIDSGETNLLKYKKYKEYIVRYLKQD